MKPIAPVTLRLSDGEIWGIIGEDPFASTAIGRTKRVLRLGTSIAQTRRLVVYSPSSPAFRQDAPRPPFATFSPSNEGKEISWPLPHYDATGDCLPEVKQICQLITQYSTSGGGVYLHAGLAEYKGLGVLFIGRSGIGKTSAIRRLPWPWLPLCDDHVLVVRDSSGSFRAHPFPTWSRLALSSDETWPTEHNMPLAALFFLDQQISDSVTPVGTGEAVCRLVTAAEQADRLEWLDYKTASFRRIKRFDSCCALVNAVPSFNLGISESGSFWKQVEAVLKTVRLPLDGQSAFT